MKLKLLDKEILIDEWLIPLCGLLKQVEEDFDEDQTPIQVQIFSAIWLLIKEYCEIINYEKLTPLSKPIEFRKFRDEMGREFDFFDSLPVEQTHEIL